jgi:uncharacterized membrane protein
MKTTSKMTWAGVLMGIIGIIISIEFLAIDAQLFGIQAPQIITTLSSMIPLNGLELNMLMTIDLLLIFLEFHWQGEE